MFKVEYWNVVLAPTNGITKHITIIHSIFNERTKSRESRRKKTFNAIPSENFSTSSSCGILTIVALQEITVVVCYVTFFPSLPLSSFARTWNGFLVRYLFDSQFNEGEGKKTCWRFIVNIKYWILDDDSHATIVSLNQWIQALNCKLNKHPNDIVLGEKLLLFFCGLIIWMVHLVFAPCGLCLRWYRWYIIINNCDVQITPCTPLRTLSRTWTLWYLVDIFLHVILVWFSFEIYHQSSEWLMDTNDRAILKSTSRDF